MFQHLDDPRPPIPSPALGERLRAEGARRRRRRQLTLGGGALGAALLALVVAQPWDTEARVEVRPSDTETTVPAPTTTPSVIDETTTTSTAPTTARFPTYAVAAVTADGELLLASIETGETVLVLDQLSSAIGWEVARAPDGSAVYLVDQTTPGADVLRYTPGRAEPTPIGPGAHVAVSRDGLRLATAGTTDEGYGIVRILDAATGDVLEEVSFLEETGSGDLHPWAVEFEGSGDRLLVQASMPESGGEVFAIEPGGGIERLGPPDGLPSGTGWYLGGPAADGEAWVQESCCALDANSYDGGRSLLRIDTRTGEVLARHALDTGPPSTVVKAAPPGAEPDHGAFLLFSPHYEGNEGGAVLRGRADGTMERLPWPAFTALDW
jgi:hypothetical protein